LNFFPNTGFENLTPVSLDLKKGVRVVLSVCVCVSPSLFLSPGEEEQEQGTKFKFWNFKHLTCEFCCPSGLLVKVSADFSLSEFVFCFVFLAGDLARSSVASLVGL
jgi:hypothetical protein